MLDGLFDEPKTVKRKTQPRWFVCDACGMGYAADFNGDMRCHDSSRTHGRVECSGTLVDAETLSPQGHPTARSYEVIPANELIRLECRKAAMRLKTELFKDGDAMAIRTNATTESDFITSVAEALEGLIDKQAFTGDWAFQLERWLVDTIEIACKLRGYKADVNEERVLTAGGVVPSDSTRVAVFGEKASGVS